MRPGLLRSDFGYGLACALVAIAAPSFPKAFITAPARIAVWTILVCALGWTSWRVAQRLCSGEGWVARLLAVGLIWSVLAASIVSYLGFFGCLSLSTQSIVVAALALGACRLGGGSRWVPRPAGSACPIPRDRRLPVLLALMVSAAGACAVSALNNVRYVAMDADNLFYHLPFVAEWVRTGSIWPSEAIPHVQRAFPASREAVHTFLSVPLRGEHLALTSILERPYFGLAIYALVRQLGTAAIPATALAVCAATVPMAEPIGNDPWLGTMFALSGLYLLTMRGPSAAVLGGLALGMLATTKFSGMVFSGILGASSAALTLCTWRKTTGRAPARRAGRDFAIACLGTTLIAWPWYARNLLALGNPLYPLRIRWSSLVLFDGPLGPADFRPQIVGWDLTPVLQDPGILLRGFGPIIFVAALGAGGLVWTLLSRRQPVERAVWPALAAISAVAFLHQPFSKAPYLDLRYAAPFLVASIAMLAAALGSSRWPALLGTIATALAIVYNVALITNHWPLLLAGALGLGLVLRLWPRRWREAGLRGPMSTPRSALSPTVLILVLALAAATYHVRSRLQYSEHFGYRDLPSMRGWGPVCRYVHQRVRDARIVVEGDWRIFPLYGDHFENVVLARHPTVVCQPGGTDTVDPADVFAFARAREATHIVCFPQLLDRPVGAEFRFSRSLGPELLTRFPQALSVEFQSGDAYLLALAPNTTGPVRPIPETP